MAFVSGMFIMFVSIVSIFYFLVKKEWRWMVLLIASYVFYWISSEYLLLVMAFSSIFTFYIGRWIEKNNERTQGYLLKNKDILASAERKEYKLRNKKRNKRILLFGVGGNLSILLFLKYFNFFSGNVNMVLKAIGVEKTIPSVDFLLPLGISFYTLQAIAYLTDVYREKYKADKHLFKFMLFMSYFPQITQGPIARHDQLAEQLYEGHSFDYKRVTQGAQLILWGFMKKLIIADRIALPVNEIFNNSTNYSGWLVFGAAIGYGLQVYTDFSGAMDIARGVSQIFGVELALNFEQPYFAKSIEEFWRRWHITLGAWMKDYVFYPLSLSKLSKKMSKGARKLFGNNIGKKVPAFCAMFIVYFLVGFWHGASWKYIVYGVWNGIFIMSGILLEDKYAMIRKRLHIDVNSFSWKSFQILRTFVLCSIGRFFSRAGGCRTAFYMIGAMFHNVNGIFLVDGSLLELGLNAGNWIVLIVALIVLFAVDIAHEKGICIRESISKQNIIFRWIVYYTAILAVLLFGMYGSNQGSATFIYQQF